MPRLDIDLVANVARLQQDMAKATSAVDSGFADMRRAADQAKNLMGILGVGLTAAGFVSFIKAQVDAGDALSKLSQKLGITVEQLSAYQYAAKLSGVNQDQMQQGLVKLADTMQTALINKTGDAARTFKALGIEIADSSGNLRDTGKVFEELSARFAGAADGPAKTAAAISLLGRAGADMIPLMNSLSDLAEEARRTGNVISSDFAGASERFNDQIDRMRISLGMFFAESANGTSVLDGLVNVLKSIEYVGIGVAQGFEQLGTRLGGLSAAAVDFAKGNWAEARRTLQLLDQDLVAIAKRGEAARAALFAEPSGGPKSGAASAPAGALPSLPTLGAAGKEQAGKRAEIFGPDLNKELSNYYEFLAGKEAADKEAEEKRRKRLEDGVENLRVALLTEEELELERYERRLALLEEANSVVVQFEEDGRVERLLSDEEYARAREQVEADHQQRLAALQVRGMSVLAQQQFSANKARSAMWQAAWKGDLASLAGVFGEMSNLMQSTSKKQFEMGKKAAIAQSLISTYTAVANALATPPIFLGIAMAAVALAQGMSNVNRIRSQQFGGGVEAGGGIAASPVFSVSPNTGIPTSAPGADIAQPPPQAAPRIINVTLTGSRYSSEEVRELIGLINEEQPDGVRVNSY